MANYSPDPLDRSPSLSSNSSATSSLGAPITPSMTSSSAFSSPNSRKENDYANPAYNPVSQRSDTLKINTRGSIGNLAAHSRRTRDSSGSPALTPSEAPASVRTSTWSPGHRSGIGAASFDSTRSQFGAATRSPSLRSGLLGKNEEKDGATETTPTWRTSNLNRTGSTTPTRSSTLASPMQSSAFSNPSSPSAPAMTRNFTAPSSPNTVRQKLSSLDLGSRASSFSRPGSPEKLGSPQKLSSSPSHSHSFSTSPNPYSHSSYSPRPLSYSPSLSLSSDTPVKNQSQALSSAIFSMKDPIAQAQAQEGAGAGGSGLARSQSFARGHKRAMTLPQLGMNGLPVPPNLSEAEVVGKSV